MNQCTDDLTRSLFARLRRTPRNHNEPESLLLKCPKCGSRLKPLLLEMFEERGENYQKIWWTCRNLKNKTCIFPLNMPPEVFWTKRSEDQMRHNVIPLPNYNLLPDELKHLYPFLTNKKLLVSKPRSSSKPTSKGNGNEGNSSTEKSAAVPNNDDVITRPESAKTPEDQILDAIPPSQNKEGSLEELKEHEKERKSRKRKNKSDVPPPLWGKKQLRGVVSVATVKGGKSNPYSILRDIRKKSLKPFQERIVTGGRNFNYNIVDESVPSPALNRIQLFPDVQSSLKSALALRFAKKDYLEKVITLSGDTGASSNRLEDNEFEKRKLLQRISEQYPISVEPKEVKSPRGSSSQEENNAEGSETSSSRGSVKTDTSGTDALFRASSQALNAFRDVEQKLSISSRLGIRMQTDKESAASTMRMNQLSSHDLTSDAFAPLSVQSENDISVPSTSNLSVDSSSQINPPLQEKISTNFDSPELHNIFQKHLHLLRSKSEKKRKRRHVRRAPGEDATSRNSQQHYGQESQQEPLFDFGMQDEQDYSIFSLGDEDNYGYDIFNF